MTADLQRYFDQRHTFARRTDGRNFFAGTFVAGRSARRTRQCRALPRPVVRCRYTAATRRTAHSLAIHPDRPQASDMTLPRSTDAVSAELPAAATLQERLDFVLEYARRGGASTAEASASASRGLNVNVRTDPIESLEFQQDREPAST